MGWVLYVPRTQGKRRIPTHIIGKFRILGSKRSFQKEREREKKTGHKKRSGNRKALDFSITIVEAKMH